MGFRFQALACLAVLSIVYAAPAANANNATVLAPGVEIQTDGNGGALVNVPGVHIQTPGTPGVGGVSSQPGGTYIAVPARAPVAYGNSPASYANASLTGMDFSHKNLAGANFSNSTLTGVNFEGSNLTSADFTNASLDSANFSSAVLAGARLTNVSMKGANLSGADLNGADLTNASLDGTVITGAHFDNAILVNVDMRKAIRQAVVAPPIRPTFVDAGTITTALQSSGNSQAPAKIDLTINFDFNSDKLTGEGLRQVQEIATALKGGALQVSRILIQGHTDNVGSDSYNQDLSYRRATRVMRSLIEDDGVPASRLSAQGFGKSRPIATNDSDLGRAMNRRVTLVNLGN